MAHPFFGKPGTNTMQSTPKSAHQEAKGPNDGLNSPGETMSFVSLEDSNDLQTEDSGLGGSTTSSRPSAANSTMQAASMESPTNSSVNELVKKAQDIVQRINARRAMHQQSIDCFEEMLINEVRESFQKMREEMFVYYEEQDPGMESSITELSELLESCNQISLELQEASQTLDAINKGLQHSAEH